MKKFKKSCMNDNLVKAKELYNTHKDIINIHYDNDKLIKVCCLKNNLEIIKWLQSISIYDNEKIFYYCCIHNKMEIAKYIYSLSPINIHNNDEELFRKICLDNNIIMAKYLYSLGDINIHAKYDEAFRKSCLNNHLEMAQYLYSLESIDIHNDRYMTLKYSCFKNNMNIIKWLYSLNILDNEKEYFRSIFEGCCSNYREKINFESAKWIYSLDVIDMKTINKALEHICKFNDGYSQIIQWLYNISDKSIHNNINKLFKICCEISKLSIIQWLHSLNCVDIRIDNDNIFKHCIYAKLYDISDWLVSICDAYYIEYIDNKRVYGIRQITKLNKLIENLEFKQSESNENCIICLSQEQKMIQLECKHIYCVVCLKFYLKLGKKKCCYCQKIINEDSDDNIIV
jgi:hypothetical protein